jgi:hypothetical protein
MSKSNNKSSKKLKSSFNHEKIREQLYTWEKNAMKYNSISLKKIDGIRRYLHQHQNAVQNDQLKTIAKLICELKLYWIRSNLILTIKL